MRAFPETMTKAAEWTGLTHDATADLLSALIRCESPDPPGDEARVTKTLARALRDLGLSSEVEEFAPRRFNILTRIKGRGGRPALVFSAHTDTLPAGNGAWTHKPFSGHIAGGRVHGRGACDMKSGLVAMVSAAVALKDAPLHGDLILAFTGGESSACLGARRLVETHALKDAGAILISEPTSLRVATAEKAALWLRITAFGEAGHLSGDGTGTGGKSAILAMLSFLHRVPSALPHDRHPLLGCVTSNVGRISGGTAINLMPDRCTVELDLRLLPHHDADLVQSRLEDMAGDGFSFERIDLKPAVDTAPDHPFAALCLAQAASVTGLTPDPIGVTYFSDAAVLCPAFDLPMAIMGPGKLGGSGGINESVAVADVMTAARVYAQIAQGWLGQGCPA
jgi:succinyl-diaminopimelate desuccinylase